MSAETGVVAEDFPEDELSPKFVDWLVDKILDFTNLLAGHNLHPYQTPFARRIIRSVVVGDGDVITAMASRQALPVDTPLLTPRGWTTMGEVQVGDEVYAPDGTSTRVHDVSPVFTDSQCFRVEFSDGRSIVADGPHRWFVYDRLNKKERTLTTDEIARDFRGSGDRFSYRYCVRVAHPVDLPEADLPLDPYLLGCWLGDGSSSKAEITTADEEIVWAFRNAGYESSYEYPSGKSVTYGFRRLYPILREEGLVKNSRRGLEGRKHVPQEYLLGSVKQRLALLQGLMDTDGHITSRAEVEFCSTTKTLAESVLFLARSLGWKAALKTGRATLNGKDCGVKYRVCWTPYAGDLEPFRLPRKVSRLREAPVKEFRARRTTSANIVGVTPVDSVPTRCIAVAHPSEMFLAGPDLIPTKNSGKTETVADVVSALMIILPRLAPIYPELLGKFAGGFLVGMFAPVETQAETLFSRCVARLTSQRAVDILGDPEIDDETGRTPTKTRGIRLKNSGSEMLMMTANPRAKIESKTFHLVVIDESQDADDFVISKSISPMLAYSSGTMVLTGTPNRTKGYFYKTIQLNKRLSTSSRGKKNHYEWNWKDVAKINKDYGRYIKKEMLRIGEDSDEFQLSYCCKWLLDRGMFITETAFEELADVSMQTVKSWHSSPVIVGIDPARKQDSTVVTVVWVDWDHPDEFGHLDCRILNWLEIQGDDWEAQYYQIVEFLANYDVLAVGVDANGVGDAVAQRLKLLLPRSEVVGITSSQAEQSRRYKHLQTLIQRGMIGWPSHAKTRRLKTYQRFMQQMLDAEKQYTNQYFTVAAPDEAGAHDDYVDSLSIACYMTADLVMPTVQESTSPFFS